MVSKRSSTLVKFLGWMRLAVTAELLRSGTGTDSSEAESDVLLAPPMFGLTDVTDA